MAGENLFKAEIRQYIADTLSSINAYKTSIMESVRSYSGIISQYIADARISINAYMVTLGEYARYYQGIISQYVSDAMVTIDQYARWAGSNIAYYIANIPQYAAIAWEWFVEKCIQGYTYGYQFFSWLFRGIISFSQMLFNQLWNITSTLLNAAWQFILNIPHYVSVILDGLIVLKDAFIKWGSAFLSAAWKTLSTLMSAVWQFIKVEGLKLLVWLKNTGIEILKCLGQLIKNILGKVIFGLSFGYALCAVIVDLMAEGINALSMNVTGIDLSLFTLFEPIKLTVTIGLAVSAFCGVAWLAYKGAQKAVRGLQNLNNAQPEEEAHREHPIERPTPVIAHAYDNRLQAANENVAAADENAPQENSRCNIM